MASSSAPASVLDDYCFREVFNQTLFESHVRRKKVIPEVGFNLNEDEYPQIKEQIALQGWRRLAAPMTGVSQPLVQEFYTNAAVSDKEVANAGQLPYKRFVRGVAVDFSPENIRRVMRFKAKTLGAEMDYRTRQATNQRLDEEFIINSLVPTGNKSEITVARAILIHSIIRGEEVRAEDIIADNMAVIAQGLQGKGNLSFPSTIYKLCKDAGQEDDDEDEQMPQAGEGNEEEEEQQQHQNFQQPLWQPDQDFQPHYENQ
ncbi:hypothetical protein PIB30_069013 [Stylosanthes scabra]|uniref:Putative plant transposon protein domain-containing protein n=1 Tax=Stylosanthes scabra TaxID=79078 RepID=A0ABU6YKN3_9FABA|nr:hypothetical protein [Stylosanthes scabra]